MRALLICLCLFAASALQAASLPDTGQDTCYDGTAMVACSESNSGDAATYPGQDGRFGRDAAAAAGQLSKIGGGDAGFDYTALDTSGKSTTPGSGATPHPCVHDNLTGLVWEVKTDDGGLHDKDDNYNWYSTNSATNGGYAGYADDDGAICYGYAAGDSASYCNTQAFVARVNAESWCGFSDWRLPSKRELHSLTHLGRYSPTIDATYFPNTRSAAFWSTSSHARLNSDPRAWTVVFSEGRDNAYDKDYDHAVRLVRGEPY